MHTHSLKSSPIPRSCTSPSITLGELRQGVERIRHRGDEPQANSSRAGYIASSPTMPMPSFPSDLMRSALVLNNPHELQLDLQFISLDPSRASVRSQVP